MTLLVLYGLVDPAAPAFARPRPVPRRTLAADERKVRAWQRRLASDQRLLARLARLRCWQPAALAELGVGFDGERITVPVRDGQGSLVGLLRYQPDPVGRRGPKVLALRGSRRELFPAPETIVVDRLLLLVEGEPDAVAAWSHGMAALAVPGLAGWRPAWAPRFAGRRIVICSDSDPAGRSLAAAVAADLARVASEIRRVDLAPGRHDGYDLTDWLTEQRRPGGRKAACRALARLLAEDIQASQGASPRGR
jgi:hypothetical protein